MPKGRAKALFTLPGLPNRRHDEVDLGREETSANDYVNNELGMNILVDKITVEQMNDSPELSPILKRKTDADAYHVSSGFIVPKGIPRHEEKTVELEGGMESLIQNNLKDFNDKESPYSSVSLSGSQTGSRNNSIELTDSESIASINSKCKKYTSDFVVPFHAQRLDFSTELGVSKISDFIAENKNNQKVEKTVELEGNMISLIEATKASKNTEQNDTPDEMEITGDSSFLALEEHSTDTEEFTGNLNGITTNTGTEGDKTVELEGNMLSLIEATNAGKNAEENDTPDEMEVTGDSSYLALGDNNTDTQEFTGNLNSTITHAGIEVKENVEFDSNTHLLPKAVEENKPQEVGSKVVDMKLSMESGSFSESIAEVNVMHLRQCTTEEHLITSIVGTEDIGCNSDKLSLLQAAKEKSKNNENCEIGSSGLTAESAFLIRSKPIDNNKMLLEEAGGRRPRKKSLSSDRFVVHQVGEVQSLVDDITTKHESLFFDKSVSFSDTAEFITTLSTSPESVDEPKILNVPLLTSMFLEGVKFEEKDGDILSNSFSRSVKADSIVARIVFERWGQFIEAVCREVERRIDLEGTAVSSLADIVDKDPRFYSMLQNRFQSSQHGGTIKKSLNCLVHAGQKLIEYEWNSWLATVLESFYGPLTETQQIYANDATKLEEALQHIQKLQTSILLMNDIETKLARKKSILRHKAAASKLEREIKTIEYQLSITKSTLLQLEQEEKNILKSTGDHQKLLHDAKLYENLRVKAESSQKKFVSLNGLHSWSMRTISEKNLEFVSIGSCPQTYVKLLYEGAEAGKANKNLLSKVDSSQTRSKSLHVYHEPVSGFLDTSTKRLMDMAQQSSTKVPIEIGYHLQKYTWLIGRLDLIAKEFQVVQRRYNGILHRKGVDVFSFSVEFENDHSTVVAEFRIECIYYPSFPIEVQLDLISGEQDLEIIKKSLVKNANPGFGSLSRACDIIQSIIRGSKK